MCTQTNPILGSDPHGQATQTHAWRGVSTQTSRLDHSDGRSRSVGQVDKERTTRRHTNAL